MDQKFFNVYAKLSYGRSPVKIQSLTEYDTLSPIDQNSILIENNVFQVDTGKKWFDLIQFADSFFFAISARVKEILEKHEITGWGSFPVQIEEHSDKEYHAFYMTTIVGKITNLEALNNYETEVTEFDLSTWKNTGFFSNAETLNIVCTQEVKEILEKEKVTNIEFSKY